jgi:peptidoglycan/xylan/chitin deacetylase (PgdA/CDA1 family)
VEPKDYGPFPFVPITRRPKIAWPDGAQIAVWVIPNIEFFSLKEGLSGHPFEGKGPVPSVRAWAQRDYGNRVGIWRMMELFEKYGIRCSPTVNSDICIHHPEIIEACVKLKWELLGHNKTNTERLNAVPPEKEREIIRNSFSILEQASGKRPVGWLGSALAETWNSLDHLIEEGCLYVADWVNDDQPYLMEVGGKRIVSIPYSYEINDSPHIYYRFGTPDEFERMIRDQFDVLYREGAQSGRVMSICLHPFMMGVPHRIVALERAIKYIKSHDKVWFATGEEIVRHYLASGATF